MILTCNRVQQVFNLLRTCNYLTSNLGGAFSNLIMCPTMFRDMTLHSRSTPIPFYILQQEHSLFTQRSIFYITSMARGSLACVVPVSWATFQSIESLFEKKIGIRTTNIPRRTQESYYGSFFPCCNFGSSI